MIMFMNAISPSSTFFKSLLLGLINLLVLSRCYLNPTNINITDNIYCSGKILHYIQMSRIFNVSKHFVDMKLKYKPNIIEDKFEKLLNETNDKPSKIQLQKFVYSNFDKPGIALKSWIPNDWQTDPEFIENIYDPKLKRWLIEINKIWKILGRRIDDDVLKNADMYSLLYIPYPFIIPGGRFYEFYYWDSFWIVDGLLISGMKETAKNMIKNYLYLVNQYGFVPNGGRVYYLNRSQPPLLIPMFELYWKATKDKLFLEKNIHILEKEFQFWLNSRTTHIIKDGIKYKVFQYYVNSTNPRPEGYYRDYIYAQKLNISYRYEFYSSIKATAESGMDFSSRWFTSSNERTNNILDINTNSIIPVCLNSIMGQNAVILSKLYKIIGHEDKVKEYYIIAQNINQTISRVFWNNSEGIWLDYNKITNEHLQGYYSSNLMPLWSEIYGAEYEKDYIISRVLEYIERNNLTSYSGGVPTSLQSSKQQWDFPLGWAPLHYFVIMGLRKAGEINLEAKELAYIISKKWILNCYLSFLKNSPRVMFEKYDVRYSGEIIPNGGGEYETQIGFGWTNGVAIKLMSLYGHQITVPKTSDPLAIILVVLIFTVAMLTILNYIYKIKCPFCKYSLYKTLNNNNNGNANEMEEFL